MQDTETRTVFPYPGGKSYHARWIRNHLPPHYCYVEPFGGAASVLFHKPPSPVEIYNDADGDVVQFFRVLRNRPDALAAWLESVPYARDLYDRWASAFYAGARPDDDIERAGRFFFLRYAQVLGKYDKNSGFLSRAGYNFAKLKHNSVGDLPAFAARLQNATIENKDYAALIDHYDGPDTLFYFDPPYIGSESVYPAGAGFDHDEFHGHLHTIEGRWLTSYQSHPSALADYHVTTRDGVTQMSAFTTENTENRTTEHLLTNFDPTETPVFAGENQKTLSESVPAADLEGES